MSSTSRPGLDRDQRWQQALLHERLAEWDRPWLGAEVLERQHDQAREAVSGRVAAGRRPDRHAESEQKEEEHGGPSRLRDGRGPIGPARAPGGAEALGAHGDEEASRSVPGSQVLHLRSLPYGVRMARASAWRSDADVSGRSTKSTKASSSASGAASSAARSAGCPTNDATASRDTTHAGTGRADAFPGSCAIPGPPPPDRTPRVQGEDASRTVGVARFPVEERSRTQGLAGGTLGCGVEDEAGPTRSRAGLPTFVRERRCRS